MCDRPFGTLHTESSPSSRYHSADRSGALSRQRNPSTTGSAAADACQPPAQGAAVGSAVTIKPNCPSRQAAASARLSPRATTASSPCARRNDAGRKIKTLSVCGSATRKSIAALAPARRLGPARAGGVGIAPCFGRGRGPAQRPPNLALPQVRVCLSLCPHVCPQGHPAVGLFPVLVAAVAESIRQKTILPGSPCEPGNFLFLFLLRIVFYQKSANH